ncbi:MAG: hypothetical protein NTZ98_16145, partial [Acidobacteria bacterium]|nr:hypothetical protein [Acidobacteriota bacterium]
MLAARLGPLELDPGRQQRRQPAARVVELLGRDDQVDAVQPPQPPEQKLAGGNVHDRDVAGQRGARPGFAQNAAHAEGAPPVVDDERNHAARPQPVARGEAAPDQQRTGVGQQQKHVAHRADALDSGVAHRPVGGQVDRQHVQRLARFSLHRHAFNHRRQFDFRLPPGERL